MYQSEKSRSNTLLYALVIANVLVYFYECTLAKSTSIPTDVLVQLGAIYKPNIVIGHQYWRLISAMFVHVNFMHILGNMTALISFIYIAQNIFSNFEILIIYFLSGIAGNIASLYYLPATVSAGASGAIMGLLALGLSMFLLPRNRYNPSAIIQQTIVLFLLNSVAVIGTDVNVIAHVAGFVTGFVVGSIFIIFKRITNRV